MASERRGRGEGGRGRGGGGKSRGSECPVTLDEDVRVRSRAFGERPPAMEVAVRKHSALQSVDDWRLFSGSLQDRAGCGQFLWLAGSYSSASPAPIDAAVEPKRMAWMQSSAVNA